MGTALLSLWKPQFLVLPRKEMMWALCLVFDNTLIRDLMEDGAVPSNLSVPKVPEPDRAAWGARSTFPHEAEPQQGLLLCKVIIGSLHRTVL